jgi:hypothetical protein
MGINVNISGADDRAYWPCLPGIFLCSASAISFEIILTRIFSMALWYHFAFMIISMAMLGLGLSGTLQSIFPGLKKERLLGLYAMGLGAGIPLGCIFLRLIPFDPVRLAWEGRQVFHLCLYYLVVSMPFFFFGLIMSTSLALRSRQSPLVYGSDLLGAGLGSVASLLLLGLTGAGHAIVLVSTLPFLGAYVFSRKPIALLMAAAVAIVLSLYPGSLSIRMSPYKPLHQALLYPGAEHLASYESSFARLDAFKSPLARFAPGLSLRYTSELPEQIGLTFDGSSMSALTDIREGIPDFVRHLPSALPFEVSGRAARVLSINPGGGLPVLTARAYGVSNIMSVESAPLVVDAINRDFGGYSGHIYEKNTHKAQARSVLEIYDDKFEIIDISLLSPVLSGKLGITEDYGLTKEAFRQYLGHLEEEGILSVSAFILPPHRGELRLLVTAIAAIEEMEIRDISGHVAAIRSWDVICMLFKRTPFKEADIRRLKDFAGRNGFDPVYYRGITASEMDRHIKTPDLALNRSVGKIINAATRSEFISAYPFDISAPTDSRPFFHYYLRLGRLGETYDLVGRKWQFFMEEGYLLPAVLLQAALISSALLALPLLKRCSRASGPKRPLIYFALLGLGFMFLEVPLIQKLILVFEYPPVAMAVVLASVLVSSGMGSLMSSRAALIRRPGTLLAIALLAAPYAFLIAPASGALSALPLALRAAACFVLVFPLGFLGEKEPELIPWAWAVNGCFSVMGPLMAALLALSMGNSWVMLLGAAMYALAYLSLRGKAFYKNKG